jgi:hypothetical protein
LYPTSSTESEASNEKDQKAKRNEKSAIICILPVEKSKGKIFSVLPSFLLLFPATMTKRQFSDIYSAPTPPKR